VGPATCEPGVGSDVAGAIVLTREHTLSPHTAFPSRSPPSFARFRSGFASPRHVSGDELYLVTRTPNTDHPDSGGVPLHWKISMWPLLVYRVTARCVSRFATSPLEELQLDASGGLASSPHVGVTADMQRAVPPFRNTSVEVRGFQVYHTFLVLLPSSLPFH
jgi:hypothetical protein